MISGFIKWLSKADTPAPWLLVALTAFSLELTALYFQYGMGLNPCIMCVYQRLAILGLVFAGMVGAFGCNNILSRVTAFAIAGVSSIWGLLIALEHVDMQSNAGSLFYTCEFIPNFPKWMPLHEWVPAIFEASGDCGEISWSFLGYSMPQWMVVVFGLYSLAIVGAIVSRLAVAKKL